MVDDKPESEVILQEASPEKLSVDVASRPSLVVRLHNDSFIDSQQMPPVTQQVIQSATLPCPIITSTQDKPESIQLEASE